MPLVLDETPGAETANTYATLAEAAAYNESRTFSDAWIASGVTDGQRTAALVEAARLMDLAFQWTGTPSFAETQALAWPRTGMKNLNGFPIGETVIPLRLKEAQAEFARQLLVADRTADRDQEKQGLTSLGVGSIQLGFEGPTGGNLSMMDAKQRTATDPTMAYMNAMVPDAVRALIVPTWYKRETVQRNVFFDVTR